MSAVLPLEAFGPRSWARPEVTGVGRLPLGTPLRRRGALDRTIALDGDWSFVLRPRPEDVTDADLTGDTSGWPTVEVPGCWTMQGVDRPHYTNTRMPFAGPPPRVPDDNPTGVHRRRLTVPGAWSGQQIVLEVGGAESVLYVHVDGRPVAMGKDSRLPHLVDLTDVVVPGEPFELALTVVRWSDASYLEDQDHWWHAGLHRGVSLRATPPVHIGDVHATADRDPLTGAGHLRVRVVVGEGDPDDLEGWRATVRCAGAEATTPVRFRPASDDLVDGLFFRLRGGEAELDVPDVAPWSAETPHLHDCTVSLLDGAGTVVDEVTVAVGFRRVEVRGAELLVNGRPVLVKGVNRHDHDPRRGKAVTHESIEADVVLMKQHNLNAIRTSHYPNDTHLYDVCDRLGMYVVDEANVEAHAHLTTLTKDARWTAAILERVQRMALRDKCHPCVIVWSLGNESGIAPVHRAAAEWLRAWDPSRPVQYEGGLMEAAILHYERGLVPDGAELLRRDSPESDLIVPMYTPVDDLERWASGAVDRPLVLCEYAHAMGNSGGSLAEYWQAFRNHHGLQGGFVWDWADQALVQRLPDGSERLAYGGDFGDEPHDGPFCLNGLVGADREPHPSLLELTAVIQPVRIELLDAAIGVVEVTNEHDVVDLGWLLPSWSVEVDGIPSAGGDLEPLDLAPGSATTLRVPVTEAVTGEPSSGRRVTATVSFRTRDPLPWAPAGHVVACSQFEVARVPGPTTAPVDAPPAGWRGHPAAQLSLWRAPIDNDRFGPMIGRKHAERWAALGLPVVPTDVSFVTDERPDGGSTAVRHVVTIPDALDDLPRVGVRLELPSTITTVEWLGFGPHENYVDRRTAARFGRWTTPVDAWPVPYVHPQASGNRTGVRWLRFLDGQGRAVVVLDHLWRAGDDDGLDVTVSRWTDEQVDAASHREDLPAGDACFVWLDARHRGVGTGAVGPDVLPPYRVGAGTYEWGYRISTP